MLGVLLHPPKFGQTHQSSSLPEEGNLARKPADSDERALQKRLQLNLGAFPVRHAESEQEQKEAGVKVSFTCEMFIVQKL
jgi:hypothetical protein